MIYGLPDELEVGGVRHKIRPGYGAVLDILTALSDNELTDADKLCVLIDIFYIEQPVDLEDAVKKCYEFINRGQPESKTQAPKLMDWAQDFPLIADAITVKLGKDVRTDENLHWWTFLGYYMNIGDCFFAQIVSVRRKLKRGEKLDKIDKEFYRNNRALIDFETKTTAEEDELLSKWIGGGHHGS